jgi:hypothetical protein
VLFTGAAFQNRPAMTRKRAWGGLGLFGLPPYPGGRPMAFMSHRRNPRATNPR